MRCMGIAELKAMLSETLSRVKAGEEIQITEHGRPIARLMPLSGASPAAATQELVRTGLVKAPEKTLDFEAFWKLPRAELVRPRDRQDEDEVPGLWELREAI